MADELRYCPCCSGSLAIRGIPGASGEHPACDACGFVLWQNAKVSAEALILRGDGARREVLLGRRPGTDLWDAPGGFINAGDAIETTLLRECRCEVGVEVRIERLIGAYDETFFGMQIVTLVYACRFVSGEPRAAHPVDAVQWFSLDALPEFAYQSIATAVHAVCAG